MKTILVTGGNGYIGSVTVAALLKKGYNVVIFDKAKAYHGAPANAHFVQGNLLEKDSLRSLDTYQFDAVIHFAALIQVGESMHKPYDYFTNILMGGLHVLEYMKERKIPAIVFSSTAAIFGTPKKVPITEDQETHPESVYGEAKLTFEKMLHWYDTIFGVKSVALRYFNAAGASLDISYGEAHVPETHLIPLAIRSILDHKMFALYGNDYPTPDGSCIRDYIHVEDLAQAHILALEYLEKTKKSNTFNLGTGKGYSNKEVLKMIEKISGNKIALEIKDRRFGDPAILLADNQRAKKVLGWRPKFSDLSIIVSTAWKWHIKNIQKS